MSETIDAIHEAAEGTTWDANAHGLWCPVCGWHVAPTHFFERGEAYQPPMMCRECGHSAEVDHG